MKEKPKKAKTSAKRTRIAPKKSAPAKAAPKKPSAGTAPLKRAAPLKRTAKVKAAPAPSVESQPAPVKSITLPKATAPKSIRPPSARRVLAVPSILFEGDAPSLPRPSGPGERYATGTPEKLPAESEVADLPEAYGTQRLLLIARDPHWLYAHWDMTADQLREHNAASRDGHLIVRVFRDQVAGQPLLEQHVHPESRNWFLHVGRGGVKYIAQLGYNDRRGAWHMVATSGGTFTPPDILSEDTSVRFETIPVDVPFTTLLKVVQSAVAEHVPLVEAIQELRDAGHTDLPAPAELAKRGAVGGTPPLAEIASIISPPAPVPPWTRQQERALAQVINIDEVRRVWMGSLEITELIRRKLEHEIASQAAAALAAGGEQPGTEQPGGISSISSPFGGAQRRKSFWFNINAELILYGATEPDAVVAIGGRKVQLRRDGTFSFRFALPDGNYDLPVQAASADGADSREAQLHFRRTTEYRGGDVGKHPQKAGLKTPRAENVK
jgi:uncharacterized protein